jgi:hypothetical protein
MTHRGAVEFDKFFEETSRDRRTRIRAGLYGDQARAAFRFVQPFRTAEDAASVGVELSFEEECHGNMLHRLACLSNLDKHRRLNVMAWWPDLVYWTSNGPSNRRWLGGDGTFANGSILGYIVGSDADVSPEVFHDFNLVLTDDPAHDPGNPSNNTEDVVAMLRRWHEPVTWTLLCVCNIVSPEVTGSSF